MAAVVRPRPRLRVQRVLGGAARSGCSPQQCDLAAGELIWSGGDCHLYLNHAALVTEQLARTPAGAPKLRLLRRPASIFDYAIDDFAVDDYAPQPHIAAPVAV